MNVRKFKTKKKTKKENKKKKTTKQTILDKTGNIYET